jgi:hypothetical protein
MASGILRFAKLRALCQILPELLWPGNILILMWSGTYPALFFDFRLESIPAKVGMPGRGLFHHSRPDTFYFQAFSFTCVARLGFDTIDELQLTGPPSDSSVARLGFDTIDEPGPRLDCRRARFAHLGFDRVLNAASLILYALAGLLPFDLQGA